MIKGFRLPKSIFKIRTVCYFSVIHAPSNAMRPALIVTRFTPFFLLLAPGHILLALGRISPMPGRLLLAFGCLLLAFERILLAFERRSRLKRILPRILRIRTKTTRRHLGELRRFSKLKPLKNVDILSSFRSNPAP